MATTFCTVRDPLLSLFQSAASAFARLKAGAEADISTHPLPQAAADIVASRQDAGAGAPAASLSAPLSPAITCANLGLKLLEAFATCDTEAVRTLRNRLSFSECDPLWSETLLKYAATYLPNGQPRPIPYVRYASLDDFVVRAPKPGMRIALMSDWGTGTDEARQVAALIARQRPDAVIHLGDIYYSGTHGECQAHFLTPLRAVMPDTPLFTLCGNHDVYSGGQGYYGLLQQIGQPASYFCLRSPDNAWQILAADTGLNDANPFNETDALTSLDPAEEAWHVDKLRGFAGRTILLSHHQPFSAFRQIGPLSDHFVVNPNLMKTHAGLVEAGPIDAWFWGHEHRLRIYAPFCGIVAGRNIGFGAVPVDAARDVPVTGLADPPALLVDVVLDEVGGAYTHGFALLDLGSDGIQASYWALTRPDAPVYSERIGNRQNLPLSSDVTV